MQDRNPLKFIEPIDRSFKGEVYKSILTLSGLQKQDLIFPAFVSDQQKVDTTLIPGVSVSSAGNLISHLEKVVSLGISKVILFGIPKTRDERASSAVRSDGIVQQCLRSIRSAFGSKLTVISDVCVCQYNLSGHCGTVRSDGSVDNDSSLQLLSEIAVSHAHSGADIVAPSSMMDGQVFAIRSALEENGFNGIRILSYSAKHSSALYAPFRSAAFHNKGNTKNLLIDKSSYQVSSSNPRQAMMEIAEDILEGADMVMIKPALWYLDLVAEAKERFSVPVVVQNVSGEYAMIKAAASQKLIDEDEWKVVSVASMRRSGADGIISYFASDIAEMLDD